MRRKHHEDEERDRCRRPGRYYHDRALGVHLLSAQQTALKRTVLQKQDLSVSGREAVMAVAELPPDAIAALMATRHKQ